MLRLSPTIQSGKFAKAAECAIFPTMEGRYVILPSPELAQHLPDDLNFTQVVVADGAELGAVLSGGYDSWRAYRDRVIARLNSDESSASHGK